MSDQHSHSHSHTHDHGSDPLPLRDIHLPDSVEWFPPAPGWWLLPVLMVVLYLLVRWLRRRPRRFWVNKGARAEIEAVLSAYEQHRDAMLLLQEISGLLKRIGMSYLSREEVAALSGVDWIERVDGLAGGRRFSPEVRELLATAPYRKQVDAEDRLLDDLVNQLRRWGADLPSRKGGRGHV